jgi:thiosulfate/3-mercaptopyruvate sulfurtransferase
MCLISVHEVARRLGDPDLRLADVRWSLARPEGGRADYLEGHIPGAVFVDLDTDLSAPPGPGRHPLPDPGAFIRRLEALSFGSDHLVVAYDDAGGTVAARLWWMLDVLGHERVAVLDGGIGAWMAAGHPLEPGSRVFAPARLAPGDRWTRTIDRERLRVRLRTVTLLDGRAPERYRGEVEPVDPAPGHIATAINLPVTGNLGPDGSFLPAADLAARFASTGAGGPASGRETVVYCGSGVNACHHALARRVAGLPDPILYPGSYSDWTRAGLPVVIGPEPGEPAG